MKINLTNYKCLPLASIVPSSLSIRMHDAVLEEHYKKILYDYGQLFPLYVRALPGKKFEILYDSGNYIYAALDGLGIPTAICCDCGTITQEQAQLLSIRHSLIEFKLDDINLAEVLTQLNKKYTKEQLYNIIPQSKARIDALLKLLNVDWDALLAEDNEKREERLLTKLAKDEKKKAAKAREKAITDLYREIALDEEF